MGEPYGSPISCDRDDAAAVHSAVNRVSGKSGDSLGASDPGVFMRRDPENDP